MSLVQYMDKSELKTRELKHESCMGFDDRNESTFRKFPNCEHEIIKNKNGELVGNVGNYCIAIPNTDPIIESKMILFPNCNSCNTTNFTLIQEVKI